MDTFQPPPPLLPDLVASSMQQQQQQQQQSISEQTTTACPQIKQQVNLNESASPGRMHHMTPSSMTNSEEGVTQMMMDCSMLMSSDGCSSGYQTSTWTPAPAPAPPLSRPSGTVTLADYPPSTPTQSRTLPPSPSPLNNQPQQATSLASQPSQILEILPGRLVDELEIIMRNENDRVVLTNSICLLFSFSVNDIRGPTVCKSMSKSSDIMNRLYYVLLNEHFANDEVIFKYATGNLTNISKCEEGRDAILSRDGICFNSEFGRDPSPGVRSLVQSVQSKDSQAVMFAIIAIHNVLRDKRIQEIAKEQMHCAIKHIVPLLDESIIDKSLVDNLQFKIIVLDCLQILAYANRENRLAIRDSAGPSLILRTIDDHLNHPQFINEHLMNPQSEELIETATRVLSSLSACRENKVDIINNGGITTLNRCISFNSQIVKSSLWTLRNLSDIITNSQRNSEKSVQHLVHKILHFLTSLDHNIISSDDQSTITPEDHRIILSCALGTLANLTCNNEPIKRFVCDYDGIEILIQVIYKERTDLEVLDPAICTLCHLMNQSQNPGHAENAKSAVLGSRSLFESVACMSGEAQRAVEKLIGLANSKTFSVLSPPYEMM